MNLAISGGTFALVSVGLMLFLLGLIVAMRRLFATQKGEPTEANPILGRNKLPDVDAFRWTGAFFKLGLAVSLCLVILAFSWTNYEQEVYIPDNALDFEDEIMVEPPRTIDPPKPPPPLPPPVIEEVPEEEIEEEEEVEFLDQTVEEDTEVIAPEPVKKALPPPMPKAPPKKVVEAPPFFKVVEQMPRFPGCEDMTASNAEKKICADGKMLKFIYQNIKYPAIARENGVEGTCVVQFIIETDGSISDANVVRDIGAGCGDEALRVVELMNKMSEKWTPGEQRGRKVRVQFNLPVKYKLQ